MSADNGYILRNTPEGKWVLQHYFASVGYPAISEASPDMKFDSLADAYAKYDELELDDGWGAYYGLNIHFTPYPRQPTKS